MSKINKLSCFLGVSFFKSKNLIQNSTFLWKVYENFDTLSFPLLFTESQREKNIGKTFFVTADTQKSGRTADSGNTLPQYLPNPKRKKKIPATCIFM